MATRAAQGMPAPRCPRVPPSTTVMPGGGGGGWGDTHASARGGWVCSAQCPRAQGCSWWPRWAAVRFVSAGLRLHGSLRGAPCPPRAPRGPSSHPSAIAGGPGTLTGLFYFAVLGWSRRGALGQLSPPTPSLLPLDQVGAPAAPPTSHLGTRARASQSRCRRRRGGGCCPPGPAQLLSVASSGADAGPPLWGQTRPVSPAGTGILVSSQ